MKVGEADYRNGAKQRLLEASILLREEQFAGSVYLAGRSVEGMLRALIWKGDGEYVTGKKYLETGHDLRELLRLVKNLGALSEHPGRDSIQANVQKVGRLWWNNMRFLSDRKLRDHWYNIG
jgi:HEPN domain-containing protein